MVTSPRLFDIFRAEVNFTHNSGHSFDEVNTEIMTTGVEEDGVVVMASFDAESLFTAEAFAAAKHYLRGAMTDMYDLPDDKADQAIRVFLEPLEQGSVDHQNGVRLHTTEEQQHWVLTAYLHTDDDNIRIWVATGAESLAIEKVLSLTNEFADQAGLELSHTVLH